LKKNIPIYGDFKVIFLILFVFFFKNTNDFDMLSMKIFLPYPEIALKKPQKSLNLLILLYYIGNI